MGMATVVIPIATREARILKVFFQKPYVELELEGIEDPPQAGVGDYECHGNGIAENTVMRCEREGRDDICRR